MKLRKLDVKDAPFMLEWMHSADVVKNLQADFASKTIIDCENFISSAQNSLLLSSLEISSKKADIIIQCPLQSPRTYEKSVSLRRFVL